MSGHWFPEVQSGWAAPPVARVTLLKCRPVIDHLLEDLHCNSGSYLITCSAVGDVLEVSALSRCKVRAEALVLPINSRDFLTFANNCYLAWVTGQSTSCKKH